MTFSGTAAIARAQAPAPSATAGDRFLDVRLAERDHVAATGADTGLAARSPRTAARVDAARAALADDLGPQAVLDVDPLTGTVRQLARLNGALTAPTGASPAAIAREYARDNATALGLDVHDVDALTVSDQQRSDSGMTVVRFSQEVDGVPSFDGGLRVGVDHAGRVISVAGAPRSDLPADVSTAPALSAAEALQRLMDQTGVHRRVAVTGTDQDARRTTRFSTGDTARLTLFGARTVHLAWHLTYQATSTRWYDAVVDVTTGEVLYRANLVKFATTANVYSNYPGARAPGGTQTTVDLAAAGFLAPGATRLIGPNVHAWADLNDDDRDARSVEPDPGEEVAPGPYGPLTDNNRPSEGCDAAHLCTWDHTAPTSWSANKDQNVTQTFWYANHFHDHLASAPIGFTPASGSFEGSDRLNLNALDGAATASNGGPDAYHINNANMATPRDGQSPRMQMYLFSHRSATSGWDFRDVNGGDDAAVLYHEYTHGLSSRLVTNDDGTQALNSPQSGAMGEGWSDWYAQDLIVRENLETDAPGTDGEIDMGRYTDANRHSIRTQAVDCSVGSPNSAACPDGGGYTFGRFGKIAGGPEVHADGEIWVQTLWQLRQALITKAGSEITGSDTAEQLITDAMRLSPPEPSYLDMRNAILAADRNTGGVNRAEIWEVFRSRGMGFYASSEDGNDTLPVEDFAAPPDPHAPKGSIAGTVSDSATGAPLAGVAVGIGGLSTSTDPSFETYLAGTSDGAGHFRIDDVPPGTYPKVSFRSAAGYDRKSLPVTVMAGPIATLDATLDRDWAATAGGARIASTNDDTGADYGCGAAALIDQSRGQGWSAENWHDPNRLPTATVALPHAVDVTRYAIDPTNTCNDDASASLKGYRLETSPDGTNWTMSAVGAFTPADRNRLNIVAPVAATANVRYVRLTLESPLREANGDSGADYIDVSELEVYGGPAPDPAAPPGGDTAPGTSTDTGPAVPPAATPLSPPTITSPPPTRTRPSFVLPRTGTKGRVRIKVTCKDACRLSTTLTADRATRRRYKLRSATVGRLSRRTIKGRQTLTVRLTADARKRLRARHAKKVRIALRARATVIAGGLSRSVARSVTLKL